MKTMTCRQLGGACDKEFTAETFDEIGKLSSQHGMEMVQKGDGMHLQAMNQMREKTADPDAMNKWMDEKRNEFDNLPNN